MKTASVYIRLHDKPGQAIDFIHLELYPDFCLDELKVLMLALQPKSVRISASDFLHTWRWEPGSHRPARLDADRTARPLTRLVGHIHQTGENDLVGPGMINADTLIDETGKRTPLR